MAAEPHSKVVPGRPFVTIYRYNLAYTRAYLFGAALSLVFVLVGLAAPLVIRDVIDHFDRGTMRPWRLAGYFIALVIIAATSGVARYYQRVLMIQASRCFEYDLRNDYFRHIQRLSQAFFHRRQTGDLMARATNDLNLVRSFVGPGIMNTVDLLRIPFTLAIMIYLSPKLTLLSLIPMPFVAVLVYFFVMYNHYQTKRVNEVFSELSSRTQENLAGARVVKAFGLGGRETAAFRRLSDRYLWENLKLNVAISLIWPFIGLVVGLVHLLILWRGGLMVIDSSLSLGDFSGFLSCLLLLAWPMAEFGWVLTLYQRGAAGMNRIIEIFAEEPEIRDPEPAAAVDLAATAGTIEFKNVRFAYNGRMVLENIDFSVSSGQTVAVVGPTGSGKSTIVSLITREFDPTEGEVRLDGVDLRRLPLRTVRDAIGYVPQDTFLFSDTVENNLTFGRPDAPAEAQARALDVAQFTETLERLDHGYQTLLGERGVNLSGGQKQRLAIARAVIREPRILILDDALSSVDTHTEEQILRRLKALEGGRTTLLISHRISSIRHADLILVLEDGRIVERGTHSTLLSLGGAYTAMYERQLLEEALEAE